ncbi:MAG: bifunctional heptose 7-phosphate kinase/heptose 1-phosphate adenyltransferase [Capsulimonadaceae bacterium]
MTKERAGEILQGFGGKRILVIGDVMLDEYIWGSVNRISPEAPVMVVDAGRYTHVPGGAANVVNNVCALGGAAAVAGVIGDDEAGRALSAALEGEGADVSGLVVVNDRPTTRKTRVIAHSQQVVRIDHERRSRLDEAAAGRLHAEVERLAAGADAILLSDYQKGVLGPEILHACVRFTAKKPVTGNLKPAALGPHTSLTILTLNLPEARQATRVAALDTEEEIRAAGRALLADTGSSHVLVTRGADGLSLFSADHPDAPVHVPARPVAVYDVAGAGDTVISALTLALAAGATPVEAVTIANYAAAEAVKKVGVATVSREEILSSIP